MKFEKTVALLTEYKQSDKQIAVEIRNGGGTSFNGKIEEIDTHNDVVLIRFPRTDHDHHVTISEIVVISTD